MSQVATQARASSRNASCRRIWSRIGIGVIPAFPASSEIHRGSSPAASLTRQASIRDRQASAAGSDRLERDLKLTIFGQDLAIEALSSAIKMSRSGLREEDKPIGMFLFAGPTGVGKTEVTVQLARIMGIELVRFDMSEYMERHTVSRLIGAPPGYVGFDQGGLLTDAVRKHPHAVVILDQAGWHGAKALQVPDNITLLPLPPRSPAPWQPDRRRRSSPRRRSCRTPP